mmetsp:Transcript_10326/g.30216  ORF Transcript_10326/g.30216 Transcript_10326/m.30216 type:complete len:248 (+) Transcript_10326:199-942(+)|eukprot:CAMPEP_0172366014 /NCGR_PEP_ID=MMETSP1060-20121228/13364_1 /TAXON_ID=37318 /ORGANISM="Pseudo-nitzschia pungens, Strain cf. cingulata" /LENGTH=247 /DNA_ID=CAMNT_0013089685 /DNA_START=84 /DNA_END=827 /DNA_ORIENTATION=+
MTDALDVAAVADAVEAAASSGNANEGQQQHKTQRSKEPPPPLPRGWIMKESRSGPSYFYYYNMNTGESTWENPVENTIQNAEQVADRLLGVVGGANGTSPASSRKQNDVIEESREVKRPRKEETSSLPKEVRVLHILKKHKDSKRPSSWRNPKITQTKEDAHEELEGLLEILQEEEGDLTELRATFMELARTESDCSSAKRGGDLGYFGRKKMQPPFEEASFRLKIGEMTKSIVDTKSGSHILLRIG